MSCRDMWAAQSAGQKHANACVQAEDNASRIEGTLGKGCLFKGNIIDFQKLKFLPLIMTFRIIGYIQNFQNHYERFCHLMDLDTNFIQYFYGPRRQYLNLHKNSYICITNREPKAFSWSRIGYLEIISSLNTPKKIINNPKNTYISNK